MTEEELEKEALAKYKTGSYPQLHPDFRAFIHGYLASAEPREKRIEELEKENAELKADNDARKFAMAMSEKVEKQLREENAELKAFRQDCVKLTEDNVVMARQRAEIARQLTKAKEIIKIFLKYEICTLNIKDELADNIAKAKAFLKSEVEK